MNNKTIKREKKYTKRSKDNCYQTTVKAYRPDGTEYWKSISSKDYNEFLQKITQTQKEYDEGRISINTSTTFDQIAEIYFNVYMYGKKKGYSYQLTYVKHIQPVLKNERITNIRSLQANYLLNLIVGKGLAKKTIKEIILIARQIVDVAVDNKLILRNPFEKLKLPEGLPEEIREPITSTQHDLIEASWSNHRMGIPNMIMLYTGIRRGELLGLKWSDVDLENRMISIDRQVVFDEAGKPSLDDPKSIMGFRKIPIIQHLFNVLQSFPESKRKPNMLVCPSAKGVLMSGSAYKRAWESWLNFLNLVAGGKIGSRTKARIQVLDEYTAHQLRHTYASMLYEAGVDVKTAQVRMGHASIDITLKVYTHLSKAKEKTSDVAFDNMISEKYAAKNQNTKDAVSCDTGQVVELQKSQSSLDNVVYVRFGN